MFFDDSLIYSEMHPVDYLDSPLDEDTFAGYAVDIPHSFQSQETSVMMKWIFGILSALTLSNVVPVQAADSTAEEYLKRADLIRNPGLEYQMLITVQTSEGTSTLQVYLKGTDKTLIISKEPARDRGRNMLMLDRKSSRLHVLGEFSANSAGVNSDFFSWIA